MGTEDSHFGIHKNEKYYHDGNFDLRAGNYKARMGTEDSHSEIHENGSYYHDGNFDLHTGN